MLEVIPDSSLSANNRIIESQGSCESGVDLAPVVISSSRSLFRLQLLIYLAMLLSASVAIFPFLFTHHYWLILWLGFVAFLVIALRMDWLKKHKAPIRFSVIQKVWRVHTSEGEVQVKPCDEILFWDAVIVLSVREVLTHRKRRIVALSDSMANEDWRRLRVWLRMGLNDNL